jgi:Glycosyltransferase Family 4
VARLQFSPAVHGRVRRWLADGDFDVLHLHEPNAPSLSMWALRVAEGPIVATFHTSTTKSLTLTVFQGVLRPFHEKIVGRIAVSGSKFSVSDTQQERRLIPARWTTATATRRNGTTPRSSHGSEDDGCLSARSHCRGCVRLDGRSQSACLGSASSP